MRTETPFARIDRGGPMWETLAEAQAREAGRTVTVILGGNWVGAGHWVGAGGGSNIIRNMILSPPPPPPSAAKRFARRVLSGPCVTAWTMGVSIIAYSFLWNWWFAIALAFLILAHEFGHWLYLRRVGLSKGWPVFVVIGAFVRTQRAPGDAYTHAKMGIAGPWLGSLAALALGAGAYVTGSSAAMSAAHAGLALNLINLLPFLPLDGGRVIPAVHRSLGVFALALLLALLAVYQAWSVVIFVAMIALGTVGVEYWPTGMLSRESSAKERQEAWDKEAGYAQTLRQRFAAAVAYVGVAGVCFAGMALTGSAFNFSIAP